MKEIDDLIKKAERFLKSAELLFKDGDYDSSVSRCYYAMFFITEALLMTDNLKASTHKGIITLFGKHFIKTGILNKEMGKILSEAYNARQIGNYAAGFIIPEEEAKNCLENAKDFISNAKNYLEKKKRAG